MAYRYPTVKVNGRTKLRHRYVMELHLGRPLARNEHVHHIDGDPFNSDLSNLRLMSAREHAAHHKQRYPLTKQCEECGGTFTPAPTKRKRAKTCSRACQLELSRKRHAETISRRRA